MTRITCTTCGTYWEDGQHYWAGTGNKGNEDDLAIRVCQFALKRGKHCINPCKESTTGQFYGMVETTLDHEAIAKDILAGGK